MAEARNDAYSMTFIRRMKTIAANRFLEIFQNIFWLLLKKAVFNFLSFKT